MAESLQKLAENLQAEISNLPAQTSSGRPTAPKDLSLISLIPKWSGTEKSVSVKEFFFFCISGVTSHNRKLERCGKNIDFCVTTYRNNKGIL